MYISSFRIRNYKSYWDTDALQLSTGFNVIVGQNNVGKSALLQALSMAVANAPHRSTTTAMHRDAALTQPSHLSIRVEISKSELVTIIRDNFRVAYVSPLRDDENSLEIAMGRVTNYLESNDIFPLQVEYSGGSPQTISFLGSTIQLNPSVTVRSIPVEVLDNGRIGLASSTFEMVGNQQLLPVSLLGILHSRRYAFHAERPNIGPGSTDPGEELVPNASNLAQVLHYFRNRNEAGFERYRRAVRLVFPQIKQITTVPIGGGMAQIYIWHIDSETERDDLAITLQESGTGIGQVLAMLYVILTARHPRIIIIDEPQSYLHPGAVRKLFEVMRQHPHHQYLITTHSPTAVTAASPSTLLMVRKEAEESLIERVDTAQLGDLRRYLAEIGAHLSDVFGYDNILWVEGLTEERAFPEIARHILGRQLSGTAILAVQAVGDLERRDAERIWDIYKRLCMGNALLPPALGFIFDRENRDAGEQRRFIEQSNNLVAFTPRRMYENYLLNARAIAALMNGLEDFRTANVSSEEIEAWLEEHRWEKAFVKPPIALAKRSMDVWLQEVHGAKLLNALFREFSASHSYLEYKVNYGYELTNWLIKNTPEDLAEIAELIGRKLPNPTVAV